MSLDVYTQHLPCISVVGTAPVAASLAALVLRHSDLAGKAPQFWISWPGGENKDTFTIKAPRVMQHKHHTNISNRNIFSSVPIKNEVREKLSILELITCYSY